MHKAALLGSAILAAAAPIDKERRQLGELGGSSSGTPSFGGGDLPFSLPAGGAGGAGGIPSGIVPPGKQEPSNATTPGSLTDLNRRLCSHWRRRWR